MALGTADIQAMLDDLERSGATIDVCLGSTTVLGLWDHEALEVLGGEMPGAIANDLAVHIATGSLPGLRSGSAITVNGTPHIVREILPYGDGAMTRVALRSP